MQENPIPAEYLNQIFCKSSEDMAELPDNSVHLMVTSPPYNVGKEYDQDATLEEYLDFWAGSGGRSTGSWCPAAGPASTSPTWGANLIFPSMPISFGTCWPSGFLMRGEIIWNKAASASPSTAWGSWRSPANPTLRDVHEYILIFSKAGFARKNPASGEPPSPGTISWSSPRASGPSRPSRPGASAIRPPFRWSCPTASSSFTPMKMKSFWTLSWAAARRPSPRSRTTGTMWATRSKPQYVRLAEKRIKQFRQEFKSPTLLDLIYEQ